MGTAFQAHHHRILDGFEQHAFYAEAIERYADDPELRARAKEVRAEQRRRFVEHYGFLMPDEMRARYLEEDR